MAFVTLASALPMLEAPRVLAEDAQSVWLADCVCGGFVVSARSTTAAGAALEQLVSESIESLESAASPADAALDPTLAGEPPEAAPAAASRTEPRRGPVLWCIHSNDPRCSPLVPSEAPSAHAVPVAAAGTLPVVERAAPRRALSRALEEDALRPLGEPIPDMADRGRLERPPRR